MAQDDRDQGTEGGAERCQSAKKLLEQITREINEFEAKKLGELKTDLDAFVKKQDQLVDGYKAKYDALRKTWCDRETDVERVYAHIKCEFPLDKEKWQNLIKDCICRKKHDIYCLKKRIAKRKRCCGGPLQRARDEAAVKYDEAKAALDVIQNLAQKIADALAANLTLIGEIDKLPSAERTVALYLFWFKLLPAHKRLAPKDISDACTTLGSEGDPKTLCKPVYDEGCKDEDGACTPPKGYEDPDPKEPRGPWLMPPDDYSYQLDCAWEAYHKAKQVLADAEAALKANPDDLASLEKKLTDDQKALEDEIKKCLKAYKRPDECCKKTTDTGSEA
jgi:hypothetical protein